MKTLVVLGIRPQIIKISALLPVLENAGIEVILVHTGQHYDTLLSDIFFRELKTRLPDYNLNVGSGNYKEQIAVGIPLLSTIIEKEKPQMAITIGDSNPALLGALGSLAKSLKIVHCEAGLRSGNISQPEELNRMIVDAISDHLFCSTKENIENLLRENSNGHVELTGDLLKDVWIKYHPLINKTKPLNFQQVPNEFCLLTIHRESNAYNPSNLSKIANMLSEQWVIPTVWTIHPGVRKQLIQLELLEKLQRNKNIFLLPPATYFEMRWLQENCSIVITDSNGVQIESYLARNPSVILRNELEHHILLDLGWSFLIRPNDEGFGEMQKTVSNLSTYKPKIYDDNLFGDGKSAQKMADLIQSSNVL